MKGDEEEEEEEKEEEEGPIDSVWTPCTVQGARSLSPFPFWLIKASLCVPLGQMGHGVAANGLPGGGCCLSA